MKKHFIFDFDDTIANSYKFNQQKFIDSFPKDLINSKSETILREIHFKTRGMGMGEIFKLAVETCKFDLNPIELEKLNITLHDSHSTEISLYSYTTNVLEKLKNKNKDLYICTNRDQYSLMTVLDQNGVTNMFTQIISCRDKGFEKPNPKCLIDLVNEQNIDRSEAIYIGDSKVDAEFASNANIDFLILDHNLHNENLFKLIIDSFLD